VWNRSLERIISDSLWNGRLGALHFHGLPIEGQKNSPGPARRMGPRARGKKEKPFSYPFCPARGPAPAAPAAPPPPGQIPVFGPFFWGPRCPAPGELARANWAGPFSYPFMKFPSPLNSMGLPAVHSAAWPIHFRLCGWLPLLYEFYKDFFFSFFLFTVSDAVALVSRSLTFHRIYTEVNLVLSKINSPQKFIR